MKKSKGAHREAQSSKILRSLARSFKNSIMIAVIGTDNRMPKKPAIFAPTTKATITKTGGMPMTLRTTKG